MRQLCVVFQQATCTNMSHMHSHTFDDLVMRSGKRTYLFLKIGDFAILLAPLFNLFCFGLTQLANNGVSISTELSDHLFCGSMQHNIVTMLSNYIVHNNMKSLLTILIYLFFSLSYLHAIIISISAATNWLYFKYSYLMFLFAYSSCNFDWGNLSDVWFFVLMLHLNLIFSYIFLCLFLHS